MKFELSKDKDSTSVNLRVGEQLKNRTGDAFLVHWVDEGEKLVVCKWFEDWSERLDFVDQDNPERKRLDNICNRLKTWLSSMADKKRAAKKTVETKEETE